MGLARQITAKPSWPSHHVYIGSISISRKGSAERLVVFLLHQGFDPVRTAYILMLLPPRLKMESSQIQGCKHLQLFSLVRNEPELLPDMDKRLTT